MKGQWSKRIVTCMALFDALTWCAAAASNNRLPSAFPDGKEDVTAGFAQDAAITRVRAIPRELTVQASSALPAVNESIIYAFFSDAVYTVTVSRVKSAYGGALVIEGVANGNANFLSVLAPDGTRHEVRDYSRGKLYQATSLADGSVEIREYDDVRRLPTWDLPPIVVPADAPAEQKGTLAERGVMMPLTTTTVIDLMLVFDTTARTWANSHGGATALANAAVSKMNTALVNSGVDCTYRLVHVLLSDHTYTGDFNSDLSALKNGSGDLSSVPGMRDRYGADIVSMMVDTGSPYGTTGLGFLPGGASGNQSAAFSVCAIQAVNSSHTMTHEIGHNMGCGHSTDQLTQPGPSSVFTYAAGWYFTGNDAVKYHTIMAYDDDGYGHYYRECNYFSTPLKTYQGVAVGNSSRGDNARTITNMKPVVSAYRDSVNQVTVTFDAQGGIVNPKTQLVIVGNAYNELPVPTRNGYLFAGWFTGVSGTEVTSATIVTKTINHTIYAKWVPLAKLTVIAGTVNGGDSAAIVPAGEELSVCANEPPIGKVFSKWTVMPATANLGPSFDSGDECTTVIMPSVNVTLTASYVAIPRLTVNGGGIEGQSLNYQNILPGEERSIYANEPASGKVFVRWTVVPATANLGDDFNVSNEYATIRMPTVSVTLTATYIAIPKLTVNGGQIVGEGATSMFILPGETHTVLADDLDGKVFEKWTVSPQNVSLGDGFNPRQAETVVLMPTVNVTLTPIYVTCPGHVTISVSGNNPEWSVDGILWSIDKVTWVPANDERGYPLKAGTYTVSFKSATSRWLAPANQVIKISCDQSTQVYAIASFVPIVSWMLSDDSPYGSGTVVLSPANGQVMPGKSVTLTARPAANYVFVGWQGLGDEAVAGAERLTMLTVAPTVDTGYTARFRLKSECELPIVSFDAGTECVVGVAYRAIINVNDEALPVTCTAISLPPGLKLDAATGVISGVPSQSGTFNVKFKAVGAGGGGESQYYAFTVAPLPTWATGTFNGTASISTFDPLAEVENRIHGSATMSITAQGKITGKIVCGGTNYVFTATSFSDFWTPYYTDDVFYDYTFVVSVTARAGNMLLPFEICVQRPDPGAELPETLSMAGTFCSFSNTSVAMYRNIWKDAGMASIADLVDGYYTATLPGGEEFGSGYMTLTVDKVGNVRTAGQLADGTAVSLSGPLILDNDGRFWTLLYALPPAYKGGCFFGRIEFVPTDYMASDTATSPIVWVRSMDDEVFWENHNPVSTGDYYAGGFSRRLWFSGGYYDKLANLREYYTSGVTVGGIGSLPSMSATVRFTDWNDEGTSKITWQDTVPVDAVVGATPNGLPLTGSCYEGTYAGTYAGDERGTWTLTVDREGRVSRVVASNYQVTSFEGSVDETGVVTLELWGGDSYVVVNGGIESSGTIAGEWEDNDWGDVGTFSGKRTSLTGAWLSAPKTDMPVWNPDVGGYEYSDTNNDGISNTAGLMFTFTQATGLFKGSFKVWYDYASSEDYTSETRTPAHISKIFSYQGALTPITEDGGAVPGRGYFLCADKGVYETGQLDSYGQPRVKTFNFNWSFDFLLLNRGSSVITNEVFTNNAK